MLMELVGIGLLLVCVGFAVRHKFAASEIRLRQVERALTKLTERQQPDHKQVEAVFRRLYSIANQSIAAGHERIVYEAAELLKLAFGSGMSRQDDSLRLMTVTVAAMKAKQIDSAGYLLDAYRPLLRRSQSAVMPDVLNPLLTIVTVAMKDKHHFLAAKVVELVFVILERSDCQVHAAAVNAAFRTIRTLGILAIRRRDEDLFRELAIRLKSWSLNTKLTEPLPEANQCLYAWLCEIMKRNNTVVLPLIDELAEVLVTTGMIREAALQELLDGWTQLAGNACLNPYSQVAPVVIARIASLALQTEDIIFFRRTVQGLGRVSTMALHRYSLAEAFLIIMPIAETGRRLLQAELTLGPSAETDFRPRAIQAIANELLLALEMYARQQMLLSTGEIIAEFLELWQRHPATAAYYGKGARNFCQLLLSFWLETRKTKARKIQLSESASKQLTGFSQSERSRLNFMLSEVNCS